MRRFQVLALALLSVIAIELGSISIKLPTPAAQAQQVSAPVSGALTSEHLELKKQLDALSARIDAKVDALMANQKAEAAHIYKRVQYLVQSTAYICIKLGQPCGDISTIWP